MTDKTKKFILIAILLIYLVYLSISSYSYFNSLYPSFADFKKNPYLHHNIKIEKTGNMKGVLGSNFTLRVNKIDVRVVAPYNVSDVEYGFVTVYGVYNKEGYIFAKEIRYSSYHYLKYIISFSALFITIYFLFKEWKFTKRGIFNA